MPRNKKEESTPFSIRLPLTVKASLEEIADSKRWSMNSLINYVLTEYIKEQNKDKKD